MIHCFNIGSRNLVLDVGSGSLHQVDDAALGVLRKMQDMGGFFADPSFDSDILTEIKRLMDAGQLFSEESPTDVHQHMQDRKPVVKALCLHMAHECNLRCGYCFAGDGTYHVEDMDRGLMSLDVGKRALDFLIANSGARRNLEVDFFGGEPMLNFDVVKALVAYGRARETETGKKFRFTLTTNGTLITDDAIGYINENFDNVVLSLDGRKHVNDNMRKLNKTGGGSYDEILPRITKLAESRNQQNYYVRGTFTCHNLDFAEDVLHMADCGFKQISIEPVVAPETADYALTKKHLPKLFSEYEKLVQALVQREKENNGVNFFHFEMDLEGGPCIAKRVTGCGAGSEYMAVTPSGQLYPCHQFVTDESFRLGDLTTGVTNPKIVEAFSNCHVFVKEECAACWAKYYCSGGCMANAFHTHGTILKPDKVSCELQKKRVECALYMYVERQGNH